MLDDIRHYAPKSSAQTFDAKRMKIPKKDIQGRKLSVGDIVKVKGINHMFEILLKSFVLEGTAEEQTILWVDVV